MVTIKLDDGSALGKDNLENPVINMDGNRITLAKVEEVFINYFEQLVEDCCNRIDVDFDYQFGKNRDLIDKNLYKELLGYLRSERSKITQNYLHELKCSFSEYQALCTGGKEKQSHKGINLENVSLIEDEQVEEGHAIKRLIRSCKEHYHEE